MSSSINFISLSSRLLTHMNESDWFVPSRCELRPLPNVQNNQYLSREEEINFCLNEQDKRSTVSYQLHNSLSTLARVVTTVAIYALVSPVGVIYHASQALYNYNITEIRDHHLLCAGIELARVATLASLVFMGLFPRILLDVNPELALIPISLAAMDLSLTVIRPIYNSRYCDSSRLPENQDANWRAQMALKWELGLQVENQQHAKNLLNDLILNQASKILDLVKELQRKLPLDHRLPHDPKMDVYRILRYLEQSRQELTTTEWEEIRPLRDQLADHNTMMSRLQEYLHMGKKEFPSTARSPDEHQRNVENAFTADGNFPSVQKRLLRPLRIHSLTQELFKWMLSSDLFYPSHYQHQKVEDLGSIKYTLGELDPYENRRTVATGNQPLFKPIRFTARALTSFGIIAVGATAGTAYHALQMIRYLAAYTIGNSDAKFGHWERAKAYAKAAFDDIGSIRGTVHLVVYNDVRGLNAIAARDDRAGLFTSITLKDLFGITGTKGSLLSYSYDDDIPPEGGFIPYFTTLHSTLSIKLWYKLQSIYKNMEEESKGKMNSAFYRFTQLGIYYGIMKVIEEANVSSEEQRAIRLMLADLVEVRDVLVKGSRITELGLYQRIAEDARYPYYAYNFDTTRGFDPLYDIETPGATNTNDPWQEFLRKARDCIRQIDAEVLDDNGNQVYNAFKLRVMDRSATAKSIFGFEENQTITKDELKSQFRIFSRSVHPDKIKNRSEKLIQESGELFKVLMHAKAILETQL